MNALPGITLLRVALGIEYLLWAWDKTRAGWLANGDALEQILSGFAGATPQAYHAFLATIVLPHVDVFAKLVTLGEWGAGITLTLGLLPRVGALTGLWLAINFLFLRGVFPLEASIDRIFAFAGVACLFTPGASLWAIVGEVARSMKLSPVPSQTRPVYSLVSSPAQARPQRGIAHL
jgi:uncharacterized membrane protein YphA (DoxX/SURF4 family)